MSAKKKTTRTSRPTATKVVDSVKGGAKAESYTRSVKSLLGQKRSLAPLTPHKSFKRTYRRDYERSLVLPGYVAFTAYVWQVLKRHRALFLKLTAIYAVISGVLIESVSQNTYSQLSDLVRQSGGEAVGSAPDRLTEIGSLLLLGLSGGLSPELSQSQQLVSSFLVLLIWLTTVWLLRAVMAGKAPRLRDGLYNSGAPIVPALLLGVLLIAQLIPAAIAAIGIAAISPTGLIDQGVEAMIFWAAVLLLVLLSLYWLTSTLIAMVVVTLPGMYPLDALKSAHELVVGRRLRIILRVVWLLCITVLVWVLVMLPAILFDAWIKGVWGAIDWLPIVPVTMLVLSSATVVWSASYVYVLYRKVVDDDATPA